VRGRYGKVKRQAGRGVLIMLKILSTCGQVKTNQQPKTICRLDCVDQTQVRALPPSHHKTLTVRVRLG
jgi:hypothetical protein